MLCSANVFFMTVRQIKFQEKEILFVYKRSGLYIFRLDTPFTPAKTELVKPGLTEVKCLKAVNQFFFWKAK